MKKTFNYLLLLILLLMVALPSFAASNGRDKTIYSFGNNKIIANLQKNQDIEYIDSVKVNNKILFSKADLSSTYDLSFRKTLKNNLVVVYQEENGEGYPWSQTSIGLLDINTSKYKKLVYGYGPYENDFYLLIDGKRVDIKDNISENGCDKTIKKESATTLKNPLFNGFSVNNKIVYTNSTKYKNLTCACVFDLEVEVCPGAHPILQKELLDISSDLRYIYFSAEGKNWTRYYSFDMTNNTIKAVDLRNIEKNKIKTSYILKTTGFRQYIETSRFSSKYFTLSFDLPTGFEVKEAQNYIVVAKSPYYIREIGDDNAFLSITRYNNYLTKAKALADAKKTMKDLKISNIEIDGTKFVMYDGTDKYGMFEGESAGQIKKIFFDKSLLTVIERPANQNQSFDVVTVATNIINSMKFKK